jgi:molecular chaperone DnaJ
MPNYYEILGVPKSANKDEIKQAYRKLAHQYHPDKGGDEKKFKEINEAYQVLGDEKKKAQYDQFGAGFGHAGSGGSAGFDGFDFRNFSGFGGGGTGNVDFSDIFSEFFGGTRTATQTKNRGSDIQIDVTITLEEAYQGVSQEISLKKQVICNTCGGNKNEPGSEFNKCENCNGAGEIRRNQKILFGNFTQVSICTSCHGAGKIPQKKCSHCRGMGTISDVEKISIKIPPGINNGETLKISGKGEANSGGYGDLYVNVHVSENKNFHRQGDDVVSIAEIPFSQAALGDNIPTKTLEGNIVVKIPAGIESGEVIKLEGKGMPRLHGGGKGSHYIKVVVKTPHKLSNKARQLLEELRKEGV